MADFVRNRPGADGGIALSANRGRVGLHAAKITLFARFCPPSERKACFVSKP